MAMISFRVSDVEKAEWQRRANLAGLSISDWVRAQCAGLPELRGVGNGANSASQPMREPDSASLAERSTSTPDRPAGDAREPANSIDAEIARKTGHPFGHDCFQCMQVRRFLEPPKVKKKEEPKKQARRR